jgi:hypothetical protein
MGWIYLRSSRDDLIHRLIAPQDDEIAYVETIAHVVRDGIDILWTVNRITARQKVWGLEPGQTLCVIVCFLLNGNGDNWGYKAMEEAVHPCYYSCPPHFLDMAPVQCAEWRRKVREYHQRHAA